MLLLSFKTKSVNYLKVKSISSPLIKIKKKDKTIVTVIVNHITLPKSRNSINYSKIIISNDNHKSNGVNLISTIPIAFTFVRY